MKELLSLLTLYPHLKNNHLSRYLFFDQLYFDFDFSVKILYEPLYETKSNITKEATHPPLEIKLSYIPCKSCGNQKIKTAVFYDYHDKIITSSSK